ncbi:DUF4126 domain-containing protein [Methylophaga nitratireducenticrescens]|uniref:Transmembrane protein n=1 Tax=Methylophaga nitratireducenticrescens TaxID=754476 RepID=I1XLF4_METNJ|nr:DUF4126 domain-containing protein [Methylophaga nitratireducenticrescens]AFI85223.1 DUF4126 domain-containing protein [Methylophaga nitratireducenticrescens]AUZ85705.1 DUF4126 domain-containing protein [Methylophaga nitratireducenticrescens]
MDAVSIIALSMGAAWASGINLYAAVFMLGYMGSTGHMVLPPDLQVLSDPLVMMAAAVMYCVEFFTDKVPGVDTGWDTLHTFIRIPAGAMLAASAVGDVSPAIELTAGLLGGSLAAATHATKAGSRLMINTSPEPFSNWTASITEDLLVIAGLWTALTHPLWFLAALIIFIVLMIWLLPRLWRLIKTVLQYIGSWLGWCEKPEPAKTATRDQSAEPIVVKSISDKSES